MALLLGGYDYTAHGDTAAEYQTALEGIADAINLSNGAWSRVYSAIYDTDYALVVLRFTGGEEVAFVAGISGAPFDTSNTRDGTDGDDDRIYLAYKPATGTAFPTGTKDPRDADFCADCGAFLFERVDNNVDVRSANHRINFITDPSYARLWYEYVETTGAPGDPAACFIASPFGAGTLLDTATMQSGDTYGAFCMAFVNGLLAFGNQALQVYDLLGTDIGYIDAGGDVGGKPSINDDSYSTTYNNVEPWVAVKQSINLSQFLGGGRKGLIDKQWLLWIRDGAVANKTEIDGGDYLHMTDGMCWPWQSAWTPV